LSVFSYNTQFFSVISWSQYNIYKWRQLPKSTKCCSRSCSAWTPTHLVSHITRYSHTRTPTPSNIIFFYTTRSNALNCIRKNQFEAGTDLLPTIVIVIIIIYIVVVASNILVGYKTQTIFYREIYCFYTKKN
jgi:hypothetical protein